MPCQPRNLISHADKEILSPSMGEARLVQRRVRLRTTRKGCLHSCNAITSVRKRTLRAHSHSRFPASSARLEKPAHRIDHGVDLRGGDAEVNRQAQQAIADIVGHFEFAARAPPLAAGRR